MGPYAHPVARLIQGHAGAHLAAPGPLRRVSWRPARAQPARTVLTHGEPHPGNTMLTASGWVLIDWDTALAAPPERDLWSLDPGDGSVLDAYADA